MAIIRNSFAPFVQPQPVSLSSNQSNKQQVSNAFQQFFQPQPTSPNSPTILGSSPQPQSNQDTSNRIQDQLVTGMQNARRLPTISPVANDPIASTQTNPIANFASTISVRPNFQDFYDRLNSIVQQGRNLVPLTQSIGGGNGISNNGVGNNFPGLGPGPNPTGVDRTANQQLGQKLAAQVGWTGDQWNAFNRLVMKESGWNNTAQNPNSTAYGIGQFLNSTWAGYGIAKTSNPQLQIQAMIRYIKARYGNPINALNFHLKHNWY